MFKVTANPTFTIEDLELSIPGQNKKGSIEVEFKYIAPDELPAFQKKNGDKPTIDVLVGLIVSWSGPVDEQEKPIPYSEKALRALCGQFYQAEKELFQAWHDGSRGARTKN